MNEFTFVLIILIFFICLVFWFSFSEKEYGVPVLVDESHCFHKDGKNRKRCTYHCKHPNGCIHKGVLKTGFFYESVECNDENDWNILISTTNSQNVCLPLTDGKATLFNNDEIGFTGIIAKCSGKCENPKIRISTTQKNSPDEMNKIKNALFSGKNEIVQIDGDAYLLQPCVSNINLVNFNSTENDNLNESQPTITNFILKNHHGVISIVNSEPIFTKSKRNPAIFAFKPSDRDGCGFLRCYDLPKINIPIVVINNRILDRQQNELIFQTENGTISSTELEIEIIFNLELFIRSFHSKRRLQILPTIFEEN